jgi:hypothetical protein
MTLPARIRQVLARRRLQRIVEARRASFEVRDYAKRREAALKGRAINANPA